MSALGGLVLIGLLASPAMADGERRDTKRSAEKRIGTLEVSQAARVLWENFRGVLRTDESALVSTEVAARMLKLTAGVSAPGVPLPDLGAITLPTLDRVPVKKALLTSRFGQRRDPINGRGKMHSGMDFSAKRGTPVRAAGDGIVIKAERKNGYGKIIYIDHGAGFVTRYAHLNSISVKEGESVSSGTRIGTVGSTGRVTGPHLHFELRVFEEAVDPAPFLGISTRGFGQRLRDLLTLPTRSKERARKAAKTRG